MSVVCAVCAVGLGAAAPSVRAGTPPGPSPVTRPVAAVTGNPMAGNNGFGVVTQRDALLGGTSTEGSVAVGGALRFGAGHTVAPRATGGFTARGDTRPTALLVGGRVDFAGSATNGVLRVLDRGYVKVGDLTGSAAQATGMNGTAVNTRLVAAGAGYHATPRIELTTPQPPSSVGPARGLMDFDALFATHRHRADALARCQGNVAHAGITPDSTVRIRLADGRTNVLRLTGAQLDHIRTLTFDNRPTATRPLVVVVDTTAEGGGFTWRTPAMAGVTSQDAPYILWNFADATDLTLTAGDTLRGAVYAPRAKLTDVSPSDIEGDVVVHALAAGRPAGSSGRIRHVPFAAQPSCGPQPASGPERAADPEPDAELEPAADPESEAAGAQGDPDPAEAEPEPAADPESEAAGAEGEPESDPDSEATNVVADDRPPAAPSLVGEMADTGSRAQMWLMGGAAALLVATGAVLTRASRRSRRRPGE